MPIFFELETDAIDIPRSQYNFKQGDWKKFQELLEVDLMDFTSEMTPTPQRLDSTVEKLTSSISNAIEAAIPKSTAKRPRNLWWNNSLQTLKTAVKRARRKDLSSHKILKTQYEDEILKAKKDSWRNFLTSTEGQDDSLIRYRILCKGKRKSGINAVNTPCGKVTQTEAETADLLLRENFPDLRLPLTEEQARIEQTVLEEMQTSTIGTVDNEISVDEVHRVIGNLRPGKAPGLDGLVGLVFQKGAKQLAPILAKLFDSCFHIGYFPAAWKRAKVVFIQKPTKTGKEVKDFRPISLLPVMGKIYEKVIGARLTWHAEQNSWVDNRQFGFQRGVGADYAALQLSNAGYTAFKKRKEMIAVFLDISGAFNEVWHAGLLYKLLKQGTPMCYIKFMNSYLSGRSALVQTSDGIEVNRNLTQSCPQGSTISPLMWNLLLNDLLVEIANKDVGIQAFADDIVIYKEIAKNESPQTAIGPALQAVSDWGAKWKIPFSHKKTEAMLFSRLRKSVRNHLVFENVELRWTDSFKYLGIVFDSKLNWTKHIDHVVARASSTLAKLNGLCSLKWGLRSETARFVYERAVLPMILYGTIVWGRAIKNKKQLIKLSRVQKLATLAMTGAFRTSALDTLQVLTGMKPIQFRIEERASIQLFKLAKDKDLADRVNFWETLDSHNSSIIHESSIQWAEECFATTKIKLKDIESGIQLCFLPHPAITHSPKIICTGAGISELLDDPEADLFDGSYYTDASQRGNGPVGAAVVQQDSDGEWETLYSQSFQPETSVFIGELLAIEAAIDIISSRGRTGNYRICSDSLSALQAIQDYNTRDTIIYNIRERIRLQSYININITLEWVRGHVGIEGNEAADLAAKRAAESAELSPRFFITKAVVKRKLNEHAAKQWQFQWQSSETGRFTRRIFPKVCFDAKFTWINNQFDRIIMYRLASGHVPLGYFLHRIRVAPSDRCKHCNCREDIEHLLIHCERFAYLRQMHKRTCLTRDATNLKVLNNYFLNSNLTHLAIKICKLRLSLHK